MILQGSEVLGHLVLQLSRQFRPLGLLAGYQLRHQALQAGNFGA
jgi:hypothetical protein